MSSKDVLVFFSSVSLVLSEVGYFHFVNAATLLGTR